MALAYCVVAWLVFPPLVASIMLVALLLTVRAAMRHRPVEPVFNVDAMRQAAGLHVVPDEVIL